MQLIGLYLNLYEGRMRMRWQSQNEEYAHLKAILASILDAITHILGEVGASIPETDFQKLMAHSSALHDWGSQ
jgi:hypothetical protein